jgi:hypothetical protein
MLRSLDIIETIKLKKADSRSLPIVAYCNVTANRTDPPANVTCSYIAEASPFKSLTAYASIQFRIAAFPRHD